MNCNLANGLMIIDDMGRRGGWQIQCERIRMRQRLGAYLCAKSIV